MLARKDRRRNTLSLEALATQLGFQKKELWWLRRSMWKQQFHIRTLYFVADTIAWLALVLLLYQITTLYFPAPLQYLMEYARDIIPQLPSAALPVASLSLERHPHNPAPYVIVDYLREAADAQHVPFEWAISICAAESNLRHFTADGSVLHGNEDSDDIGICQINRRIHPQYFPAAESDWQQNITAALTIMADCRHVWGQADTQWISCYNGIAQDGTPKNPTYYPTVKALYDSRFWSKLKGATFSLAAQSTNPDYQWNVRNFFFWKSNAVDSETFTGAVTLEPAVTFSVNEYFGGYTSAQNMREAPEIGDGACNAASMLHYVAAISGLQVSADSNTHDPVPGVPAPYLTTVYAPGSDLRITNPFPQPVTIHWDVNGDTLALWIE